MTQSTLAATAIDDIPNDNLSVPYGLIRTIRHYLEFVGLLSHIRGLKSKGLRLDLMVVAMCTYTMYASNSLNSCANWLDDPTIRRQFGFSKKEPITQKTLNRGLGILGRNREGIIARMWNGIQDRFEIDDYEIRLDGSAVVLYGTKSEYAQIGYGRDKNRGKYQVEFMVAQLASLGLPIYIKPYKGNTSDEEQYRDCVPELASLLSEGDLHSMDVMKESKKSDSDDEDLFRSIAAVAMLGATIVADNGIASKANLDRVCDCGMNYVTLMSLNTSDDSAIIKHASSFEYLGDGMFCYTHIYAKSKKNRRTFLFLSRDKLVKGVYTARKRLDKDLKLLDDAKKGNVRRSDYVKVRKVPWMTFDIRMGVQDCFIPRNGMDKARIVRENMGLRCGFFKLETNMELTAEEALSIYRRRAGIEQLISSLKRITGIKPIRVWNKDSVDGAMVLALLGQAAIAMARHCMAGRKERKTNDVGKETVNTVKPSTESMVRSLTHLTLTRFKPNRGPYQLITSNWDPISTEVLEQIRLHESPEWGSKKVPSST